MINISRIPIGYKLYVDIQGRPHTLGTINRSTPETVHVPSVDAFTTLLRAGIVRPAIVNFTAELTAPLNHLFPEIPDGPTT